ncbi:MAG: AAA family ATPase [Gemmataceae bacterium]|nr:AAA family ATPase [Gemmataceae bacterium]
MITSIELHGIRGIREGRLTHFTPLVILVGRNGCGKSTILDGMIVAGNQYGPGLGIGVAVKRHQGVRIGGPWLFWRLGTEPQIAHKVSLETDSPSVRESVLSKQQSSDNGEYVISCATNTRTSAGTSSLVTTTKFTIDNDFTFDTSAEVKPLPGIGELRFIDVPSTILRRPLHELYSDAVSLGRRTEAKGILAEVVPGLSDVEILTEGDSPIVHLVFDTHSVPAALAGDGIYSLLRIVLSIAARQGGVVLIEEPELHLHPGAMHQTAKAIWAAVRRGIQFFITTHSLEFIDMLLAESKSDLPKYSLYHLRLENGQLLASRSSGDDIALARGKIQDDLR